MTQVIDLDIPVSILLVDDNPAKLTALEAVLIGLNLEIVTAPSGTEALRHLLRQDFAVVLLDVNMPILDGFETAVMIRSRPRSEQLPIIFITAERLTDEARLQGYALGAVDYILSPVLPEILRAKVKVFADLYRLRYLFGLQFELGNIGIAVAAPDTSLFFANPKCCEMLGYSADELQQRTWVELTHPDDVAADLPYYQRLLSGAIDRYELDKRFIRKDGAITHARLTVACHRNAGRVQFLVAGLLDINERKRTEEELKLAALLYQNSTEGVTVSDADGTILDVNPAFTRITGYPAAEVIGKNPRVLQSGRHDPGFYQALWRALTTTGHWQGEIWNKRKNGEVYVGWLTINTIGDAAGAPYRRVAQFSDITEKKQAEQLIWHQANFDHLTQLPNRRLFADRLAQEIKTAARTKVPLALLFIDLDRFKEINDTLGHEMGDLLLTEAARRLRSCVREVDTVARLGGD